MTSAAVIEPDNRNAVTANPLMILCTQKLLLFAVRLDCIEVD